MGSPIVRLVRRHPLAAFFVLAYALSWWGWPLYALGLFADPDRQLRAVPGGAGGALRSPTAAPAWGRCCAGWCGGGSGLRWYAVALLLPVAVAGAAAGLNVLLGAQAPRGRRARGLVAPRPDLPPGAPHPRLRRGVGGAGLAGLRPPGACRPAARRSAPACSWGRWWPGGTCPSSPPGTAAGRSWAPSSAPRWCITWVFNSTGGSVLLTMLLHATNNTVSGAPLRAPLHRRGRRHPGLAAERAVGPGGPRRGARGPARPASPAGSRCPRSTLSLSQTPHVIRHESGPRRGPAPVSSRRRPPARPESIPIPPAPGGQPTMLRRPAPALPSSHASPAPPAPLAPPAPPAVPSWPRLPRPSRPSPGRRAKRSRPATGGPAARGPPGPAAADRGRPGRGGGATSPGPWSASASPGRRWPSCRAGRCASPAASA